MRRTYKIFILSSISIFLIVSCAFLIFTYQTKQDSPEEIVYHAADLCNFVLYYNRPFVKERKIFGNLVPYNQIWRTGANEPTTLTFDKDILLDGSLLKKGTYSLWTVPKPSSWKILLNSRQYCWGINLDGSVARDPQYDALVIEVPSYQLTELVEQFTISFKNKNEFIMLTLEWENTGVRVPIQVIP
ncbi:DUF2911 domain-containing protein [Aquimarina sp. W85]|uniref:DUF2911 domain-containing protein n=1 Tax=Aquimarina rhodophyticola TaxID=3342246 RepID=UPI00366AEEFC